MSAVHYLLHLQLQVCSQWCIYCDSKMLIALTIDKSKLRVTWAEACSRQFISYNDNLL